MYEDDEYCYQQQCPLNACFSKAGQFLSCDIANINPAPNCDLSGLLNQGNGPAQRIRVHLAQLAITNELHSIDHEYEIHESAMAAREKAGIKILKTYRDAVNDPIYGLKWKKAIAK